MGKAGVVNVGGVRIGGLSGIYNSRHYNLGHFEFPPYDRSSLRSVYHVRSLDVYRLSCLRGDEDQVDCVVSHDWPLGIAWYGDTAGLFRRKKFLEREIRDNTLGSPPARYLLDLHKPKWWFSAHLHCRFTATVNHPPNATANSALPPPPPRFGGTCRPASGNGAIGGQGSNSSSGSLHPPPAPPTGGAGTSCQEVMGKSTNFLALDKCLPRKQFLEIVELPRPPSQQSSPVTFSYDPEWIAILRGTHNLTTTSRREVPLPQEKFVATPSMVREAASMIENGNGGTLCIPENFAVVADPHREVNGRNRNYRGGGGRGGGNRNYFGRGGGNDSNASELMGNPQTDAFLRMLGLPHIVTVPYARGAPSGPLNVDQAKASCEDDNEINIDGDDDESGGNDDNEINIDDDDDDDGDEGCNDGKSGNVINKNHEDEAGQVGGAGGAAAFANISDNNEINIDDDDDKS